MIDINSLTFRYKSTVIFDNFSWYIHAGDSWVVIGPSGCGKSTLLGLLSGLLFPKSGTIKINDQVLSRPRPQTGLILQDYGLLPWATVSQNANLGLELRNFYGADGIHAPNDETGVFDPESWLERLGLSSFSNKYPSQISGGQRQRTAIARTLATNPDLLLMDEPFSSLDAPTRETLQQLTLILMVERGLTLVLVTHSIEEAALLGKKILLLRTPPNHKTCIIENPLAGSVGYRDSENYSNLCKSLRNSMESERSI